MTVKLESFVHLCVLVAVYFELSSCQGLSIPGTSGFGSFGPMVGNEIVKPEVHTPAKKSLTAEITDQITEMNITLTELEPRVDGAGNCACSIQSNTELNTLSSDVTGIEEKCAQLQTTISNIEQSIAGLSGRLGDVLTRSDFDQMTSDLTDAKNNLDQLYQNLVNTYNPGYLSDVDEVQQTMNAIKPDVEALESTIASCAAQCQASGDGSVATDVNLLHDELMSVQSSNQYLVDEITNTKDDVDTLMVRADSINCDGIDTTMRANLDNAESRMVDIATSLNEKTASVANLAETMVQSAEFSVLSSNFNGFHGDTVVEELLVSVASRETDVTAVIDKLNSQSDSLNAYLTSTENTMTKLNALLGGITETQTYVSEKHELLTQRVEEIHAEVAQFESSLENAGTVLNGVQQNLNGVNLASYKSTLATQTNQLDEMEGLGVAMDDVESHRTNIQDRLQTILEEVHPTDCPSPFEYDVTLNMCFYVSQASYHYHDALRQCAGLGQGNSRLITFTEAKRVFFANLFLNQYNYNTHWIGLFTKSFDWYYNPVYMWSDGSLEDGKVTWRWGYPSGSGIQCGALSWTGELENGSCGWTYRYICEIPMTQN